jgi:hypothetical protein
MNNEDTNTPTPKQEYTLESIVGATNMDAVIKSAVAVWDNFLEKYPESFINKTFLQRNLSLIHKLIETIIPNVMRHSVELEEDLAELTLSYEELETKRIQELLSMASVLKTTVSCIKTVEELEDVNNRTASYGTCFTSGEKVIELRDPLWLLCILFPNETLSPIILTHDEYTTLVGNNKYVTLVELEDCALMATSEEVDDLLQELDLG